MVCSVQDKCGGCPTLHLGRGVELLAKVARVHEVFEQVGLLAQTRPPITGEKRTGYRNRLRMKVADGRVDLFNQSKDQGCVALRPGLWDAITVLRQVTHADPNLLFGVAHLEVRVADCGQIGLSFVSINLDNTDWYRPRLQSELGPAWRIADRVATSQPTLRYDLSPTLVNDVPIDAFVQVNSEVNRLLVSYVSDIVSAGTGQTFLDLYCGAGNLSLPLIEAGLSGVAVERNGSGPTALVERVDGRQLRVLTGDVHDLVGGLTPAQVVITNPARSGLKSNHETIASLASDRMVCVGCEPGPLASDIAELTKHGFYIDGIQTFDMFPGTDHIETVVTLLRYDR